MELWIRSQDREDLIKAYNFRILYESDIAINVEIRGSCLEYLIVGKYKTKERAIEVLDDIQNRLKATFLMKPKDEKFSKYVEDGKKYLENLNGICVVTGDRCFDLEPINKDIYVYEMPKE